MTFRWHDLFNWLVFIYAALVVLSWLVKVIKRLIRWLIDG